MPLSDFFPSMKGGTPVTPLSQQNAAPVIPNDQTQVSGYLRTTIPLPLQYAPDTLKQYNRPGLSSYRIAPLPPGGNPSVNAASTSTVISTVQEIVSTAAGGSNGNVQFNSGGALAGSNNFDWNNVASVLSITGSLTLTTPLAITSGGTGTSTPALIAGQDITITGSWPNNTISVAVQAGVTPGSYTSANVTVDSSGIITAVASGTEAAGGFWNTVAKSISYSAVVGDMVLATSTSGSITITLPASSSSAGRSIRVKKVSSDANTVTIARSGSDLIDNQTSQVISFQYTDIELTADGTNWWIA